MESPSYKLALNIVDQIKKSIIKVKERSENYHCADDYMASPLGMMALDSICMQFIAIGESLKNFDRITKGELLNSDDAVDWRKVMGLRDIIAHKYFDINADVLCWIIEKELPTLEIALSEIEEILIDKLASEET